MISKEVLKKIRHIEIATRRLLSGSFVGDHSSARKGSGFEFDQIREYAIGDDVRFIDWNSSARMNKLLVKEFIEERDRTVVLLADVSGSQAFGSETLKRDVVAQLASALAMVAEYGKDYASLILFDDEVATYLPPARGRLHTKRIMEALFTPRESGKGTNITAALEHLMRRQKQQAIVMVISDFIDENFERALGAVARKHDVVALRCLDAHEHEVPAIGLLEIRDPETGQLISIDTGTHSINQLLGDRLREQKKVFARCGVDLVDVASGHEFLGDVIKFFRRRMMY